MLFKVPILKDFIHSDFKSHLPNLKHRKFHSLVLGPVYTTTNTQRVAIYPGQFKSILVIKISPDSGRLHGRHAKENETLVTFFTTGNLSGLPCLQECANNKERINISSALL